MVASKNSMISSSAIPCGTYFSLSHKNRGERIMARKSESKKGTTIAEAALIPASTITTAAIIINPYPTLKFLAIAMLLLILISYYILYSSIRVNLA